MHVTVIERRPSYLVPVCPNREFTEIPDKKCKMGIIVKSQLVPTYLAQEGES